MRIVLRGTAVLEPIPASRRRSPGQVREFIDAALKYAESIAIAVGPTPSTTTNHSDGASCADHPKSDGQAYRPDSLTQAVSRVAREATQAHANGGGCGGRYGDEGGEGGGTGRSSVLVNVFMVTPWGKFVPALNALLGFAARDGADLVMFQVRLRVRHFSFWRGFVTAHGEWR